MQFYHIGASFSARVPLVAAEHLDQLLAGIMKRATPKHFRGEAR